jgi:integrase
MANNNDNEAQKVLNFAGSIAPVKKPPQKEITDIIVKAVNKNKFNYHQLKNIFSTVRARCDLVVPIKKSQHIDMPTSKELKAFYSSIEDPVHKLIFEVLQDTGLRIAELTSVAIKDIDLAKNTLVVKKGKGGKSRVAVFSNYIKEKITIYLDGRNNKFLFESNRGTKFTTRRIQYLCDDYILKSKIATRITPHTFRHIWNTHLAMKNIPRDKREILAGHSHKSNTQEIYTHLSVGGIKDDIIKILDDYHQGK